MGYPDPQKYRNYLDKMNNLVAARDWPNLAVAARRFAAMTRLTKKGRPKADRTELRRKIEMIILYAKAKGLRLTKTQIAKAMGISRQTLYAILR